MRTYFVSTSLLFAGSTIFTTALAQNTSCYDYGRIPGNVNSTGQREFTWNSTYAGDDPWYVSVLIKSQGPGWDDADDVRGTPYISVPGNVPNDTGLCIYSYTDINVTLEDDGKDSCSGVISSACVDFLTDAMTTSGNGLNCPSPDNESTLEAYNKACPMLTGTRAHSSSFVDVNNGTCAYTDLPEVQIPDGYNTFGTVMGLEVFKDGDVNADANQKYDIMTRQTIPLVLLGRFVDPESNKVQYNVEFVCLNANKTVEGSRVPEEEKPWESTGAAVRAQLAGWVAAVVVAAILAS